MSIGADDPNEDDDYMRGLRRDETVSRIIVFGGIIVVAAAITWLMMHA